MESFFDRARLTAIPAALLLSGLVALVIVLAATSPASAAPASPAALTCTPDAGGANDLTGQKDLTLLCLDTATPGQLLVTWNWDEISMPGGNTADGCALFDSNADGLADYAVCNSWGGSQTQTSGFPVVYSCNNSKPLNCGGATAVALNGVSCPIGNATDDPFPAGDAYPRDTKSSCTIPLTAVGGAGSNLIDVCSYPSGSPTSNPGDCVATSTAKGNINVTKVVQPADTTTNWNIAISGPTTVNKTIPGGGSTGVQAVTAGTYTISEAAGTNTSLAGFATSWACNRDGTALSSGTGTSISGIQATNGTIVNCTFTNASGFITVDKVTDPPGAGHIFVFNISPAANTNQPASFEMTDAATPKAIRVQPNTGTGYTVTETPDPAIGGWTLQSASCVIRGTSTQVGTVNLTTGALSGITVAAGQYVDCTFTNKVGALAVTLANFEAQAQGTSVQLSWETVSEQDTAGFNLYRGPAEQGPWERVNPKLIPSRATGSASGATYSYSDNAAGLSGNLWYLLEDVSTSSVLVRHEPAMVTLGVPNALQVRSLAAARTATWPVIAGVLGVAAVGTLLLRRRAGAGRR